MGRVLAVDFGLKRTGIAVTDELKIIASPLETVNTADLIPFLIKYIKNEKVECLVVGAPKRLHNVASEIETDILTFISELIKQMPSLKIEREDERFTSKMAMESMIQSGAKKKDRKQKGNIDKISAAIILQSFLSRNT